MFGLMRHVTIIQSMSPGGSGVQGVKLSTGGIARYQCLLLV